MEDQNEGLEIKQKKFSFQWKEITNDFLTSIEDLDLGELLHYEMFGLFEAMSAIEMMDKKMDIGMIDDKDDKKAAEAASKVQL